VALGGGGPVAATAARALARLRRLALRLRIAAIILIIILILRRAAPKLLVAAAAAAAPLALLHATQHAAGTPREE
jgi:hypothetical protein